LGPGKRFLGKPPKKSPKNFGKGPTFEIFKGGALVGEKEGEPLFLGKTPFRWGPKIWKGGNPPGRN